MFFPPKKARGSLFLFAVFIFIVESCTDAVLRNNRNSWEFLSQNFIKVHSP